MLSWTASVWARLTVTSERADAVAGLASAAKMSERAITGADRVLAGRRGKMELSTIPAYWRRADFVQQISRAYGSGGIS